MVEVFRFLIKLEGVLFKYLVKQYFYWYTSDDGGEWFTGDVGLSIWAFGCDASPARSALNQSILDNGQVINI